jgi:hypothetical protein
MATVTPESFTMVLFDHGAIVEAADAVAAAVGLPAGEELRVEVDESNPLTRSHVLSVDPLVLAVDGGAFEDPRHPRELDTDAVAVVVGRLVRQALDRRDAAFGEPPPDDALSVPHRVAWDVYALGRMDRLGYPAQRQRRLYNFRNRHGFTDRGDAAFDALWNGEGLTWADIERLSDAARAVAAPS